MIEFLRKRGYTVMNLIEIRKPYKDEKLTQTIVVGEHEFDYWEDNYELHNLTNAEHRRDRRQRVQSIDKERVMGIIKFANIIDWLLRE